MVRLLCIISAMNTGGAETFLMKIYRNLDLDKYQMDFCVNVEENYYADEISSLGGKIYIIPNKSKHPIKAFVGVTKIVHDNGYKRVIRINEHSLSTLDLLAAKIGGARVLAMRSSNAGTSGRLNMMLHYLFRFLTRIVPNVKMAPSTLAAEYTFGKKVSNLGQVTILKNGLDVDSFAFCSETRKFYRKQLGIQNEFVIGHVGRFSQQKNHVFLVDIFYELLQMRVDAKLVMIGVGELESAIQEKVQRLGIQDKCIFLGTRNDVNHFLNAMDVFVFPSFYEGMPNTIIEAQTNGLPCLISDTITEEAGVTDVVRFLSLKRTAKEWADEVLDVLEKSNNRTQYCELMRINGYSIKDTSNEFINLVLKK